MVKIKTIKKMNLPELIQWGWDNEAIGRFEGDKGSLVLFDANSWVISNKFVCSEEFFEVEIEEEITEDTKVPRLIEMYEYEGNPNIHLNKNITIKELLNDSQSDPLYVPKAFYILNDDMTMKLLWKDEEMVE
ncbi:hypothetical protein NQ043_05110 [Staphylococcus hyicus]|uniref:hypothetical protein n=1 Tax=Staphylococcus hyicus TaxID=1284 RepID=UPI00211C3C1B|nr:hypothetical protein [Staphylococcus hyicus]MCQ9300525.1 hypothetical protein [Staphylococcus hyicus]